MNLGHVYHRDCIERIIHVQPQPQCHICSAALPVPTALLKLFIVLEESDYDKEIQDAVRRSVSLYLYSFRLVSYSSQGYRLQQSHTRCCGSRGRVP